MENKGLATMAGVDPGAEEGDRTVHRVTAPHQDGLIIGHAPLELATDGDDTPDRVGARMKGATAKAQTLLSEIQRIKNEIVRATCPAQGDDFDPAQLQANMWPDGREIFSYEGTEFVRIDKPKFNTVADEEAGRHYISVTIEHKKLGKKDGK